MRKNPRRIQFLKNVQSKKDLVLVKKVKAGRYKKNFFVERRLYDLLNCTVVDNPEQTTSSTGARRGMIHAKSRVKVKICMSEDPGSTTSNTGTRRGGGRFTYGVNVKRTRHNKSQVRKIIKLSRGGL
jgi:hypothetical protein